MFEIKKGKIFRSRIDSLLLVGVWVNRNWILGNWLKEIKKRKPNSVKIFWVLSVFANKNWWEKIVKFPLPKHSGYFFSYPSIFESYLDQNFNEYRDRSIVNYTHNDEELGTLEHQAKILNHAYCVHFNCSKDAEMLCANGLEKKKVRLIYGAIDDDCLPVKGIVRDPRTILLASSFSKRKGVEILPEIVKNLADWNFLILGRGWDKFLNATSLLENQNVHFEYFNKVTRNIAMSRAGVFLSLSNLEGGPMPLIESMSFGVNPVATDTGFARDFIKNGINGFILPLNPTVDQVCSAIIATKDLTSSPTNEVSFLTWDRITKIVLDDFHKLKKSSTIKI